MFFDLLLYICTRLLQSPPHLEEAKAIALRLLLLGGANLLRGYRAKARSVLAAGRIWEDAPLRGQVTNATLSAH